MLYSKYYFEKYAQLTLKSIDCIEGHFRLLDKPDLQNIKNSVGIEVVNVETQEEGNFRYLWNTHTGKELSSDTFQSLLVNDKLKQKVITGLPFMAAEVRTGEARDNIDEIINTIQNKALKFNKYKQFNQNGLYLFDSHIWEEQMSEFQARVKQNKFPFNFYILNLMDKLIFINDATIKRYDLTELQRKIFKRKSEQYEQNRTNKHVLHLVLKHSWYHKIVSGEKTSEYRECSDYWNRRLTNKHYDTVIFHKGYTNTTATYKIISIGITTKPNDLGVDKCWEIKLE